MSKKSRRSRSEYRARQIRAVQGEHLEPPKPVTQEPTELASTKSRVPRGIPHKSQHPVADYHYVGRELRYISILAASLVAVLIILSFFLG